MTYSPPVDSDRRLLWALAYRMVGDAAEADDIVQDVYVRALEHPVDASRPLRPWLVTVTLNLARDRLRARKRRGYLGTWLPSPVEDDRLADERIAMRESASMAWLVAAEALTPTQRAVWLCREVLDLSAAETAEALGTTPGGADVALHKARVRLRDARPSDRGVKADAVIAAFLGALQLGLRDAALRALHPDAVMLNDGGQRYHAGRMPIVGARKILTFLRRVYRREPFPTTVAIKRCNGAFTVVIQRTPPRRNDAPAYAFALEVHEGRIVRIYTQLAPERLTAVLRG